MNPATGTPAGQVQYSDIVRFNGAQTVELLPAPGDGRKWAVELIVGEFQGTATTNKLVIQDTGGAGKTFWDQVWAAPINVPLHLGESKTAVRGVLQQSENTSISAVITGDDCQGWVLVVAKCWQSS